MHINTTKLQDTYENEITLKYQIYNGLFLNLPFSDTTQAGARLPIFTKMCKEMLDNGISTPDAVDNFLNVVPLSEADKRLLLNKFLQFIERQIVLFDALENQAFNKINDMAGKGSIEGLFKSIADKSPHLQPQLDKLLNNYHTRLVLTAHPTQFYPNKILAIINRLDDAIETNNIVEIRNIFLQMGLTSFYNKNKPTPDDEADSVIWYLRHIFYNIIPTIQQKLGANNANLELGFWPGGDRDGNPFVTHQVTLATADKLHSSLMRLYYADIKALANILTFDGTHEAILKICKNLKNKIYTNHLQIIHDLENITQILSSNYNNVFVDKVNDIITKIHLFRFNFAKIDIRQNSAIHSKTMTIILANNKITENYAALTEDERILILNNTWNQQLSLENLTDINQEVIDTIRIISDIQYKYGNEMIERYIISNTDSIACVLEVLWLVNQVNYSLSADKQITLEVIPLFESIDDLKCAKDIMEYLFNHQNYKQNIHQHHNRQTIMLGFSDGTKDGGYLMANWAIFKAKKQLSTLAKEYDINITFFDGRGGPPSRGGGKIYEFYQSVAEEIDTHDIQLTIQGQTISSNFGTLDSAIYNFEHLLSAGISGKLMTRHHCVFNYDKEELIDKLANYSLETYLELKNHPLFLAYLQEITPLKYLSEANIGSRPAKRSQGGDLKLEDLRAIPFGSAWMQMKQNILGYYGFGSAVARMLAEDNENLGKLQFLYECSNFFKGLVDNSMQSLAYTDFTFTNYLCSDEKFSPFWQKIKDEADLTSKMLLLVANRDSLIIDQISDISAKSRQQIIFPLALIQQYAMYKLRHLNDNDPDRYYYEQLIRKSLASSINASRNSI